MLTVDDYGRILRAHRDGMSIREMARTFHHSRHKIRKILHGDPAEPGKYPRRGRQSAPKLGRFHDRILEILKPFENMPLRALEMGFQVRKSCKQVRDSELLRYMNPTGICGEPIESSGFENLTLKQCGFELFRSVRYLGGMSEATFEHSRSDRRHHATAEELLPHVYEQLRGLARSRMAKERDDHTLQPTALVHEAYQRLTVGHVDGKLWDNEGHFFAAAAKAMRRILIESARSKKRQKRGGNARRVELDQIALTDVQHAACLLDVDEGLRRLALEDAESAALVELRLFGGLSVTEAGEILGQSRTTAYENWNFARCWFATFLQ